MKYDPFGVSEPEWESAIILRTRPLAATDTDAVVVVLGSSCGLQSLYAAGARQPSRVADALRPPNHTLIRIDRQRRFAAVRSARLLRDHSGLAVNARLRSAASQICATAARLGVHGYANKQLMSDVKAALVWLDQYACVFPGEAVPDWAPTAFKLRMLAGGGEYPRLDDLCVCGAVATAFRVEDSRSGCVGHADRPIELPDAQRLLSSLVSLVPPDAGLEFLPVFADWADHTLA